MFDPGTPDDKIRKAYHKVSLQWQSTIIVIRPLLLDRCMIRPLLTDFVLRKSVMEV